MMRRQRVEPNAAAGSLTSRVDRLSMAHAGVEEAEGRVRTVAVVTVVMVQQYRTPHCTPTQPSRISIISTRTTYAEDGVFVLRPPHTTHCYHTLSQLTPSTPSTPATPPLSPPQMTLHIWLGVGSDDCLHTQPTL